MNDESKPRDMKPMIWGLFLIALGGAFLLERFDLLSLPSWGKLWPVILIVIGIGQLAEGRFGSSVQHVLTGFWFLACGFDWYGLTYRNSWPLLLVAIGAGMVIRAISGEDAYRRARKRGTS